MSSTTGPTPGQIDQLKLRQIIADIDLKREQLMQAIAERDARREQGQADIGLKREQLRLEPRRFRVSVWSIMLQGIGVSIALGGVCVALGVAIGHGWR